MSALDLALAISLLLIASASAWATMRIGMPAGAAGDADFDLWLIGAEIRAAIFRLRQELELSMSAESDALKAALDAFEPKVDAFVSTLLAERTASAEAVADKAALSEARDRIAALEAQIDAAMASPAA